ncbi:MAG: ribosome biogenesis GTPase Der [Dehalococcoidia bacterium]|nr:ribosome biogenesis GTPase Der [Dehalococcoidia bacterium]
MNARKSIVAIIGRQNVGKSTLLNRLAHKRVAIVEDMPGTTRDRVFADAVWQDKEFTLVDTGGLEIGPETELERGVRAQVNTAIQEADLLLYVTDVKDGIMPTDYEIADMLRKTEKPVILVVNKTDNDKLEAQAVEFYQLGLGDPIPISAHHARGTGELLDRIVDMLPAIEHIPSEPQMMKVAIVGRPNVGKSMLLNTLLGQERSIVSEMPGTTRDAIDTPIDFQGKSVVLIDTAGIRRRGQVEVGVERYSVLRALRAIDRCDVALLVLDATELVTAQDMHVAGYIQQAEKGIVLVVNKWDLVTDKNTAHWEETLRANLKFVVYAPVMFVSAKTGQGIEDILPVSEKVYAERIKRLADAEVRSVVQQALAAHPPPRRGRRELVIKGGTQTGISPPAFTFRVNDAKLMHFSYRRYLENQLRQAFGFAGTPIRLEFTIGGGK